MNRPLCMEELRKGLFVCQLDDPEKPGTVVSWKPGDSPAATRVEVRWLGEPATVTPLSGLQDFRVFVTDVRAKSEAYRKLLTEIRRVEDQEARRPRPGERRDCLTCRHRSSPISQEPCVDCRPVTGGAVNWIRRDEAAVQP